MAIRRDELDVVPMDLQMPVMGGLEATRKIRGSEQGTGRHIPIVAMTAHAATQDQKRCEEAGMDGHLSKPIRSDLLRNEIERVTGGICRSKREKRRWNIRGKMTGICRN